MEELIELAAILALAAIAFVAFAIAFQYYSTPAVCRTVELVVQSPGSSLVVYGKVRVWASSQYVYFSCGLAVPKDKVLAVERTEGVLTIGTTADGLLYIK